MRRIFAACLMLGLTLPACGGNEQPPALSPISVPTTTAAPTSVAPDVLEPVAAPRDIVVLARGKTPEAFIQTLGQFINLPIPWKDELIKKRPILGPLIDTKLPVDVAVIVDPEARSAPKFLAGVSFAVGEFKTALEQLRSAGVQLERITSQLYFLQLEPSVSCGLARANGPAPARLICTSKRRAIDLLAPYMAATLPTEQLGDGQVRISFKAEPLRRRYGGRANMLKMGVPFVLREFSQGSARFDSALADAAHGLAGELIRWADELDEIDLVIDIPEKSEQLELRFELAMRGTKSWLSKTLLAAASQSAQPPEIFWTLPKDAFFASYFRPSSPPTLRVPLGELLAGGMDIAGVEPAKIDAWAASHRKLSQVQGAQVLAMGRVESKTSSGGDQHYQIFNTGQDEGLFASFVKQSVEVLNDAKLRGYVAGKLGDVAKKIPQIRALRLPKGLPKGSAAYSLELPHQLWQEILGGAAKERAKPEKVVSTLIVVPAGDTSWVGYGADVELVADQLKNMLTKRPAAETLASRDGLGGMRASVGSSGLFFTLDGMIRQYEERLPLAPKIDGKSVTLSNLLLAMPNRGRSPITLLTKSTAGGPRFALQAVVPRAAAEDIAAGAMALAAELGAF